MRYLALLIIPIIIISCAKEESDSVSSVLQFTTASIKIDSIDNYTSAPACMNFSNGSSFVKYTVNSEGHYGSSDVDSYVRNSYFRITQARLYFNGIILEIPIPGTSDIKYNASYSQEQEITKAMLNAVGITDGIYNLSIEMVVTEYNGNNIHTVADETISSTFGQVQITSDGTGCQ